MRASVAAEKAGIPSVTDVCSGFAEQARLIAKMAGVPGARTAAYPGHIDTHSPEQRNKYVEEVLVPQIIQALTEPLEEGMGAAAAAEPGPRDIVFTGTFDEVNAFFYDRQWSDGLPIVPPSIDRVEEFLKYTDRAPDEVLGIVQPSNRRATVWSVAVNGVMAGCRPEYMPILIAMVEVMADQRFRIRDAGATPGWEALVILNGPIVKELNFNCKTGALRPGPLPNTSVGRFWRLYVRNVAGLLPGTTDKGTWGRNFHVVLAENHDALDEIGWEPLSVRQGFQAHDNVVTIQSIRGRGYDIAVKGSTAKENLDVISYAFLGFHTRLRRIVDEQSVLLGLTPLNAAVIARDGYSKKDVGQYLWEHARQPAHVFEAVGDEGTTWKASGMLLGEDLCDAVGKGILPKLYCECDDPNRMLPVWRSPDDLRIVVGGDPGRNRALITGSNAHHGLATSRKIVLPVKWGTLIRKDEH